MLKITFAIVWLVSVPTIFLLEVTTMTGVQIRKKLSPVNVDQHFSIFKTITDSGATCIVEMLTDIPDTSDIRSIVDWASGSAGHCFLKLTKQNQDTSVSRYLGFYPLHGWKTILNKQPVRSMFVNDSAHTFDATIFEKISPDEFRKTIEWIIVNGSKLKYDINDFNCTDFAIAVFNLARHSKPVMIPKQKLLSGFLHISTPQCVFGYINNKTVCGK